jgi:lysophospholipase L1-like esterase
MGHLDRSDLNPDFIILLVGINNSWDPEEPLAESVLAGIRAVLDAAHARKSSARIVLQTLLPTNDPARNAQVVAPVNVELAAIARDEDYARFVLFLDLHAAFVDEGGNQIAAYFNDGLHPNEAGYRAWRDRLIAFLDAER